jgi:hypothetical protein
MQRGAGAIVVGLVVMLSFPVVAQVSAGTPSSSRPAKSSTKSKKSNPSKPEVLQRDIGFGLLQEAYASSRDLSSDVRVPLLAEICHQSLALNARGRGMYVIRLRNGTRSVSPATRVLKPSEFTKKQKREIKDWAEELYTLGQEFPAESDERNTATSASIRAMIEVDLDRAMELYAASRAEGSSVVNRRFGIEFQLFDAVYREKGVSSLPELRSMANEAGDRGSYPFEAVSSLLHRMNGNPDAVREFFSDAVSYYRQGSSSIQRTFGLLTLLSSKQIREQLEPWQVQDAVELLAEQANQYVQAQRELQSLGSATAPNGPMMIQTIKNGLRQFAPEIAATIPEPPPIGVTRITSSAARQPQTPVPDESLKVLNELFEENRTQVMVMNENEVHDGPEMRDTIDRAVSLGSEFVLRTVRAYDPEDHLMAMRSTIPSLIDTVQVGTRVNPAATLSAVRKIQDSEIRTRLLVTVAGSIEFLQ